MMSELAIIALIQAIYSRYETILPDKNSFKIIGKTESTRNGSVMNVQKRAFDISASEWSQKYNPE